MSSHAQLARPVRPTPSPGGRWSDRPLSLPDELPALALVLAASLACRLIFLDRVPANVMPDEADNLRDVVWILAGKGPEFIGLDWTQLPALNAHLMAAFVRVFGLTVVGMRMVVVFTSTLALVPFYLLVRRISASGPALMATLMFSTSLWYLNFSRTAWPNIHVVLFGLLATWLVVEAAERGRWFLWGLAGVAASLLLYGYYAGRATFAALLLCMAVLVADSRGRRVAVATGAVGALVVALLLFFPMWQKLSENWEYSNTRMESVFIFHQDPPYLGERDPARLVVLQAERTLRGFLLLDGSLFQTPRYTPAGSPPVDYVTGALFLGGLILGLRLFRASSLWYILFFLPLLATQLFSINTPDTARAIVVVPAIYAFVAVALDYLWRGASRLRMSWLVPVACVLIAAFNIWWYFDWSAAPATALARQPAVEYGEFDRWLAEQRGRAERGEPGFTVTEWHEIRKLPSRS